MVGRMVSCAVMSHMKIGSLIGVAAALGLSAAGAPPRLAAAAPTACEALAQTSMTNATILSAESVQAGAFTPPGSANASAAASYRTLPAFCRVTARLTPSADSDIRVE